jgi:rhomboid family GlyGly-CTERM serine protease
MGLDKSTVSTKPVVTMMWLIPLIYIAIAVLIMLGGEAAQELLRYDRVWLGQGEVWRFVSGHLTHMGWPHLALNSAGLVLVWYLVGGTFSNRSWLLIIAVTLATIDVAFWFRNPELYWYVGMSGLLHGLLAAGIVAQLGKLNAETGILLLLLSAKIVWEQWNGPVPGSEATSGGTVIVDAHLYGALGGILGALLARIRVRPRTSI